MQRWQRWRGWLVALALVWGSVLPAAGQGETSGMPLPPEAAAKISPFLAVQAAQRTDSVEILVWLTDQPDVAALADAAHAAAAAAPTSAAQRTVRTATLYAGLTAHAAASQADLRAWLEAQAIPYRPFYLVNMIQVWGDYALVETLSRRADVARLEANPRVAGLDMPPAPSSVSQPGSVTTPYGISLTRAPEVWDAGYRGQGIVVAGQDTGVEWDHPALRAGYRGVVTDTVDHAYHWLDAWAGVPGEFDLCAGVVGPCDDHGHGTHTVGTLVGQTPEQTLGMAPDAQWMGCRNMRGGYGTPASYTACFEFFLAPYPQGGDPFTQGRPELAPHVINNSWGCPPSEGCSVDTLQQVVETVRAAGLMVVASAGNSGWLGCSSIRDPIAVYDAALTVGATDAAGLLAGFSSRGPVTSDGSGRLKPDLTAPGVGVYSTMLGGGYATLSGTSMAAPHVAGAVALLWSAAPWLIGNPDLTDQVLIKSASPVLAADCRDDGEAASPNSAYGYGQLDVAAAVMLAQTPWTVTLTVTALLTVTAPLTTPAAAITWVDTHTGYTVQATTNADGVAVLAPVLGGRYTATLSTTVGTLTLPALTLALLPVTGEVSDGGLHVRYTATPASPPAIRRSYFPYFPYLTQPIP